ncbi:unnamed protein product [Brassica oleracea var. botrytis]
MNQKMNRPDFYPTQHTLIGWFPSHIHHQIAFCSLQAQLLKACGTTPATPTWKLLNVENNLHLPSLILGSPVTLMQCFTWMRKHLKPMERRFQSKLLADTVVVEKDTTENNEVRVVEETDAVVVENGALSSDASSGKGITPEKQTENVKNVEAGKTVEWNNRDETLAPATNDLVEKIKEKEDIEEEEDKWLDVSPTKQ